VNHSDAQHPAQNFSLVRRIFHWTIATLLLIQIPLAWYMIDLPLGTDKFSKYGLHKSIGMLLFVLAVSRLVWTLVSKRPALPATTPLYEKILAKLSQALLYALVILMPVTGWLMSSAANVPVVVFGLIRLPNLVEPDKAFMEGMQSAHEIQSIILLMITTVHILAALKHHFVTRNNILCSMLPLVKKR
jgi:cytochrome b561